MILDKVLYSGTHSGDWLDEVDVVLLQKELKQLRHILKAKGKTESEILKPFIDQMTELVEAALALNKPIVF